MADIVKLLQEQPDFCSMAGASNIDISNAEQLLALRFASDYRQYVAAFGAASFSNHELTGVCKSKRLNVVDVTITERKNNVVPNDWYVLEQTGVDGIVFWQAQSSDIYQTSPNMPYKKICNSLSEYLTKIT